MTATVRRIALLLALFVVVVFAVFLFNQTTQIVQSARVVNPTFGNGVMWGLILTYCLLLITPFVLWFKVPKRVTPPAVAEGVEYDRFMADFRKRLSRNSRLHGIALEHHRKCRFCYPVARQARGRSSGIGRFRCIPKHSSAPEWPTGCAGCLCSTDEAHLAGSARLLSETIAQGLRTAIRQRSFDGFHRCWNRGRGHRCSGWNRVRLYGGSHSGHAHPHKLHLVGLGERFPHPSRGDDYQGILPLHGETRKERDTPSSDPSSGEAARLDRSRRNDEAIESRRAEIDRQDAADLQQSGKDQRVLMFV